MDITNLVFYELTLALKHSNKTEPSTLTREDLNKYIDEVRTPTVLKVLGWSEEDKRKLERIYGKGECK